MDKYDELVQCGNFAIVDAAMKCRDVLSSHKLAVVSVSGGADSDVMVDLVTRTNQATEIIFTNFDTGIEYDATKDHLRYLEDRYGIEIRRIRAIKTIPVCCKEYGLPFLSKMVSHQIEILQHGNFRWEDEQYTKLTNMYPNIPKSAIKWWTNTYGDRSTIYRIDRNPYLKEFIMEHPPEFPISDKCCVYAKKEPSKKFLLNIGADLCVIGVRKSEGGIRSTVDSCFSHGDKYDIYRPLFWMEKQDRQEYEEMFGIVHSECYRSWGFVRTGCVGCPFDRDCESQLAIAESNEPRMAKAANKVFGKSYEYTRMFREFRAKRLLEDEERALKTAKSRSDSLKKSIEMIDRKTGEVIKRYASQIDAEADTGIAQSSISSCIHGKRPSAGGYYWRFSDEA